MILFCSRTIISQEGGLKEDMWEKLQQIEESLYVFGIQIQEKKIGSSSVVWFGPVSSIMMAKDEGVI